MLHFGCPVPDTLVSQRSSGVPRISSYYIYIIYIYLVYLEQDKRWLQVHLGSYDFLSGVADVVSENDRVVCVERKVGKEMCSYRLLVVGTGCIHTRM